VRILRLPFIVLSIAPIISLFRAWQATDARVKGLLSDVEAQRQLLTNVAIAGTVYLVFVAACLWHIQRQRVMGVTRKTVWMAFLVLLPMIAVPAYLIIYGWRGLPDRAA
jgi:hypothetical protein